MKVYVKNKVVSLDGSSSVVNSKDESVYDVKGKFFSILHKKMICDLQGKVLYIIKNKWFNFFTHSAYICDETGEKVAKVKKPAFTFRPKFIIEGYKDEIKVEGEFFNATMKVIRNDVEIGTISREFTLFADSFCVEGEEADMPLLVALTIAIDNIYDNIRKDRD